MKIFKSTIIFLGLIGCTKGYTLTIEGKISINGYAQHSYISVKDKISQLTYKLKNGSDFNLTNRQHENIKLKIKVLKKAVGPGFPAIVEVMKVYDIQ
jgi:hypothetical protein